MNGRTFAEAMCAAFVAAILLVPLLGGVPLFDWDEINFAECAREMLVTGNYGRVTMNYAPFWEKPPLFFWLQAAAMRLFGINEFSARLPNAVAGTATTALMYLAGVRLAGRRFALLWIFAYLGSFLPFLYFKSGIIDPVFNLFIYWSFFCLWLSKRRRGWAAIGGVLAGLAVLTKGPVGLLLPTLALAVLTATYKFRLPVSTDRLLLYYGSAILSASSWFAYEWLTRGPDFIVEFVEYQIRLLRTEDAGHGGFFGYHFVVLLVGCLPASLFAIPGLAGVANSPPQFHRWNLALFWTVLAVFSLVETKILHYSSLCYYPLTFVAAWELHRRVGLRRWQTTSLIVAALLVGLAVNLLAWVGMNAQKIIPLVKDPFAAKNLEAQVDWSYADAWPAWFWWLAVVIAVALTRKGATFRGAAVLFGSTSLFLFFLTAGVVPKIERYTQGAAVDFFRSLEAKDVYVATLNYKSYAHYFYARTMPPGWPPADFLVEGAIDKPAYFSVKIQHAGRYEGKLEKLYEKNGFVFFMRRP
ncbi:MAG: glycosyltransferase family 39 protein, partial [Bacteroidia bacterium]|nr:glycosyltransferase family 39 protein [Bacteroidia bacterium]